MKTILMLLLASLTASAAGTAESAAHPADAEAYALLGRAQVAKGDADAAVSAWEKAVELAPANSDYQRELGDTYGFAAQKAGMLGKMSLGGNASPPTKRPWRSTRRISTPAAA